MHSLLCGKRRPCPLEAAGPGRRSRRAPLPGRRAAAACSSSRLKRSPGCCSRSSQDGLCVLTSMAAWDPTEQTPSRAPSRGGSGAGSGDGPVGKGSGGGCGGRAGGAPVP